MPAQLEDVHEKAATCNIIATTPSILATLPRPSRGDITSTYPLLHTLLLGGETAPQNLLHSWLDTSVRILNGYGPCETTCTGTIQRVERDENGRVQAALVGQPMAATPVHLVDENLNIIDTEGVDGEIVISGRSLATGYYKDESKTAQSFFTWKGTRIYRTGDFGRWTSSAQNSRVLEFRGRRDRTVKNRGFLVNLEADVEVPLRKAGSELGVQDVHATMFKGRLVAVVRPECTDVDGLMSMLRAQLCSYQVPSQIEVVQDFPLSANGKIQPEAMVRMLEETEAARVQSLRSSAISASTEEACAKLDIIATCVAEALGWSSTRLGPDENFFKLGGQSHTALQVVSLCRARGICITVRDIYSSPTIEALTARATVLEPNAQRPLDPAAESSNTDLKLKVKKYLGLENGQFEVGAVTELQLRFALPTLEHDGLNTNQLRLTYRLEDAQTAEHAWTRLWYLEPIFRTELLLHLGEGMEVIHTQPFRHPWTATYSSREQYTRAVKDLPFTVGLGTSLSLIRHAPPSNSYETGEMTVVLTIHHSLMDGHSLKLLLQKVSKLAQGDQLVPSPSFPQAKLDLIDIQKEKGVEAKSFWADYLKRTTTHGAKASTITVYESMVARAREFQLDYSDKIESLAQLAAECHVTRAAVYYTAWATALSEHPADDTVVAGAVFSGRESLLAHQDTIGTFMSTLPLVVELKEEFSVTEQLQRTMKGLAQISQYTWTRPSQIPFQPDNLLAVQPCLSFSEQLPSPVKTSTYENSAFPLSLLVNEEDGQFRLVYNPSVISDDVAAMTGNKFQTSLNSLLRRGSVTIQSPSSMASTQKSLRVHWPAQQRQRTVASAFEDSARCHANLRALEDATGVKTYAMLDAEADIIAHQIRRRAPLAKTVAIYGDGTMNWCVAILGALKAGCAYCPLDPNWSPEFKASVFERSGSGALVVSSSDQRKTLPTGGVEVIVVADAIEHGDLSATVRLPEATVSSDDNFIIVFTSGTTGVSKGVPITHRSFLALQSHPEATMFSRPGRRIAQFMSPAFDACALEVFSALLHGGTLVLRDVEDPYAHLGRVDAALITPSVMGVLDADKFPNLSMVYSTGEPVTPALVNLFGQGRQFYNAYGPAEGGICASFTKLAPGDRVTIGHGLPTARMYLLGPDLQSADEGEIFIAGEQVMRGYIGSSEETARRVMADPWHRNDRMYRTGDYGRRTEAGTIEYIGRLDRMVKFRGFRVELPGIEQAIYSVDAGVVLAAALVVEEKLVAFVKPSTVDIRALRMNLAKNLPTTWVPQYIIPLDDIPTTANKKTDFRALATLVSYEQLNAQIQKVYVPLESEQEAQVAHEWRQILKLDSKVPLSATEHFLRVGGHSVLQILLAERLSRMSGVRVSVRDVIQAPILRDQAALLQRLSQQDQSIRETTHAIPHAKPPSKSTAASEGKLSELEQQVWFQYQIATNVTAFNIGAILHIHGTFEHGRLVAALNTALNSQPILLSNFVEHDQGPRRELRKMPLRVREVSCLDYDKVVNTPFDLAADELMRTFLVGGQTVFICTTHAIADLNSIQSFLRLVSAAYAHPTHALPASLSSYIDSEVWERQATEVEKSFWREYLRDRPQSLKLARQPTVGMFEGQSRLRHFDRALVSSLEQRVRQLGVTKHQLALAALAQTLHWLTGQADIVLGAPLENRPTSIERDSVGLFLERVPVRLQKEQLQLRDTSGRVSALLRAAQNSSQQAVAHAIPFSELLDLVDERSTVALTRHPIFECVVTFHLRDAVARCLDIPGCSVTPGPACFGQGSKFLLMCEWSENADGTWGLRIEYDSCRIPPAVIDAMERCLDIVLAAFAQDCTYLDLRKRLEHITAPKLTPWKLDHLSALIAHEMTSSSDTKIISCSESFFSAGADSVAALKLRRRLLRHGIDVSLRTIMHLQTPQQLAEYLVRCL